MSTEQITKQVRARFDHNRNKKILREKYEAKMLFAYAGGMWRAGPELITLLHTFFPNTTPDPVLLDIYDTPCKVNVKELFEKASQHWEEQMNAWYTEYEELRKMR